MSTEAVEGSKNSKRVVMLTTVDNPFNPHTHYSEWFAYDLQLGHNTTQLLSRIVVSANTLSDPDQHLDIENAIDELVALNPTGLLRKVVVIED